VTFPAVRPGRQGSRGRGGGTTSQRRNHQLCRMVHWLHSYTLDYSAQSTVLFKLKLLVACRSRLCPWQPSLCLQRGVIWDRRRERRKVVVVGGRSGASLQLGPSGHS
jgi:hypothetical protein